MHLANLKRVLTAIFIAVAVFLSACGGGGGSSGGAVGGGSGGGGSGDSGGSGGGSEPVAYRAAEPVVAMDSLVHFSVSGLEGNLLIADADGSEYQVLSDGVTSADYYSVGSRPQFRVSVQPVNQHCEIDAGTLYAVPSHDDFIQISCLPLLMADPSATYLPGQMVFFGLTVEGLLTGEVQGLIDDVYPVDALVWNGILGLMMPIDLAAGAHTLELTIGGRDITHAFELTAPLEMGDAETYIIGELDRIQEGLEALLPTADTQGQAAIQGVLSAISQMRDTLPTLSSEELLEAAYFLAANNPENFPIGESAKSMVAMGYASRSLLSAGVSAKSVFDAELCWDKATAFVFQKAGLVYLGALAAGGAFVASIATNPAAGALIAVAAGSYILYKVASADLRTSIDEMIAECVKWEALLEGASEVFSARAMLSSKTAVSAKSSSPSGSQIKHISLVHGEAKSIPLWAKRTVPPAVESLIRTAQQELMPVSGIFDEILEPLYLFEFTKVLPVDDGSVSIGAFQTSGYAITRNYSQSGNIVDLTFEFSGDEYPENPQAFSMTFLATVTDGAEAPEAVELPVRGSLHGGIPIAFNSYHYVEAGSSLEGEFLRADHAESYVIVEGPSHGALSLVSSITGEFKYVPDVDFEGEDSFTFKAVNRYGESLVGKVDVMVDPACEIEAGDNGEVAYKTRVCSYPGLANGDGGILAWFRESYTYVPDGSGRIYKYFYKVEVIYPDLGWFSSRINASYGEDGALDRYGDWAGWRGTGYWLEGNVSVDYDNAFVVETRKFERPSVWEGVRGVEYEVADCQRGYKDFMPYGGTKIRVAEWDRTVCPQGTTNFIRPLNAVEHIKAGVKQLLEIQEELRDPRLGYFGVRG